eukprot:jgi/Bigna1/74196/fgenesh1_pg.28_\
MALDKTSPRCKEVVVLEKSRNIEKKEAASFPCIHQATIEAERPEESYWIGSLRQQDDDGDDHAGDAHSSIDELERNGLGGGKEVALLPLLEENAMAQTVLDDTQAYERARAFNEARSFDLEEENASCILESFLLMIINLKVLSESHRLKMELRAMEKERARREEAHEEKLRALAAELGKLREENKEMSIKMKRKRQSILSSRERRVGQAVPITKTDGRPASYQQLHRMQVSRKRDEDILNGGCEEAHDSSSLNATVRENPTSAMITTISSDSAVVANIRNGGDLRVII